MSASRKRASRLISILTIAASLGGASCSRQHYHKAADTEVTELVAEKAGDPRWAVPRYDVEMDPRSRYYEIYNQDKPPMPPDDPASHQFMHAVDGMDGYQHWHKYGDRPQLENPWWREQLGEYVPITADGKLKMSLDSAVEVGRINSPDYQQHLETIYLSALDVSTERFRFDVQFLQSFSGGDARSRTWAATACRRRQRHGVHQPRLADEAAVRHRRRAAGRLRQLHGLAVRRSGHASPRSSILNFSLVQPLLRGGGRVVALEQLTIAERGAAGQPAGVPALPAGLLHERRHRRAGTSAGPQRRGGFFGGTGLTGFTGTGRRRLRRRGRRDRLRPRQLRRRRAAGAAAARASPAAAPAPSAASSACCSDSSRSATPRKTSASQLRTLATPRGQPRGRRHRPRAGGPVPAEHRDRAGQPAASRGTPCATLAGHLQADTLGLPPDLDSSSTTR